MFSLGTIIQESSVLDSQVNSEKRMEDGTLQYSIIKEPRTRKSQKESYKQSQMRSRENKK